MRKGKTSSRQSEKKEKGMPSQFGKKEKANAGQSEKKKEIEAELGKGKGIKVLVPLLSKREAEPAFIEAIASKSKEIVLLLVIDTNAMTGRFGFATNEIATGNALMQQVKVSLGKKRKTCNDVIEWGDTATKIEHLAQFYQVDRIYVVKQDNQFFKKILQDMREKLHGIEIEAVPLPEWR